MDDATGGDTLRVRRWNVAIALGMLLLAHLAIAYAFVPLVSAAFSDPDSLNDTTEYGAFGFFAGLVAVQPGLLALGVAFGPRIWIQRLVIASGVSVLLMSCLAIGFAYSEGPLEMDAGTIGAVLGQYLCFMILCPLWLLRGWRKWQIVWLSRLDINAPSHAQFSLRALLLLAAGAGVLVTVGHYATTRVAWPNDFNGWVTLLAFAPLIASFQAVLMLPVVLTARLVLAMPTLSPAKLGIGFLANLLSSCAAAGVTMTYVAYDSGSGLDLDLVAILLGLLLGSYASALTTFGLLRSCGFRLIHKGTDLALIAGRESAIDAPPQSPWLAALGLAGLALAHLGWNLWQSPNALLASGHYYIAFIELGILNSQPLLLALMAAFASGPFVLRLLAGLGLQLALTCAVWTNGGHEWGLYPFLFWNVTYVPLAMSLSLVRHWTGWRIAARNATIAARPNQFGLRTMLVVLLVAGLVLTWVRHIWINGQWMTPTPPDWGKQLIGFGLSCLGQLIYLPWLGLVLGTWARGRFAIASLLSLPAAVALSLISPSIQWSGPLANAILLFGAPHVGMILSIVVSLLVVRGCGSRLVREQRQVEKSEMPAAEASAISDVLPT